MVLSGWRFIQEARRHGDPKLRRSAVRFFSRGIVPKTSPPELVAAAKRKLRAIEAAETLGDLANIPGNRLEKLKGNRAGQWSIRLNDRWRICFLWQIDGAHDVEVADYH